MFTFSFAQNLVPNYSFETISFCPESFGGTGLTAAPPWFCPTQGSSDIFNACSSGGLVGVPNNFFGNQPALTGVGYAGGYCKLINFAYREYICAPLTEPMVAGEWYYVSFYVSPAEYGCAIEKIGAYLSVDPPTGSQITEINVTPQIENNTGFLNDYDGWTLISGCFQALGGERHITLGNFHNDANTPVDPACGINNSYYYYEDVIVGLGSEPGAIDVDLGGPVEVCFSYEIDPELTGYLLTWEDGSHGPTLTVTESGVYNLTVSDGCNFGEDSIEVIINGSNGPLDIGPAELTLCTGEEYEISLDPDVSEYTWQDGSNDPAYTITTPGVYSVTLDDGCDTYTDEITIFYLDPPAPVDLGPDGFLCSGDEIEYDFDPSLGDFLWQDGNTSSNYTIDIEGNYALTISNICGSESDEIVITNLEVPEVQIGPDEQTLCDNEILEIEIDPDLGDILWQDGSSQPNYEITTSGIYTVFVTNQCGTGSDQVEVSSLESPDIDLGPDVVLCEGETLLLGNDQEGDYLWQDGSTENSFLVTGPGDYSLTISNACGSSSDFVYVEYTTAINPVDLGPDVVLCPGEQFVLYTNNPGSDYLWQDFSTADTFLVTTSGTYTVQVFNDCALVTDTIIVVLHDNPPQVDLPDQLSLCQGQSLTLDAVVTGVDYLWNDNSQNQQLTVTSPGTYSVTISSTCGSDEDTVIVTDGGPAPVVDLGTDLQICAGESVLITPVFDQVDTWLWYDGSTSPTFLAPGPGMITVEVTNACGLETDTLQISLLPATPPLDLGPDTSLCAGESFTISISTPGVSIEWSDGSTGPDLMVSGFGQVFSTITNSCGSTSDTIIVSQLPDAPTLNLGPDQSLCPGELITLSPGIPDVTYLWQDGSTNTSYQSIQQETIILIISNECSTSTDTLEIFESTQGPQVNLGSDIQVCEGNPVTISSGISGVTFEWQDGSNNPNFTTLVSGTFILEVSNNCGSDTDTIVVDISGVPPSPDLGPDTTLCEGVSLVLLSDADAETTIEWQDGSSNPLFTVTTSGIYSVSESNRCGDASDAIQVTYLDAPDPFTLGPDTTLCPGESVVLNAPTTSYDILWHDGTDQASFMADQAGTFSLQVSNDCGLVMDEVIVTFDTRTIALELGPEIPWCEGDIFALDASQTFPAQYNWSTGSTSSAIEVLSPGVYSVEIAIPCSSVSDDVVVVPSMDCVIPAVFTDIYVPNVFSPNDDGINDVFTLTFGSDIEVISLQGSIFDRWGNMVFESSSIPFTWNGRFKEELLQPGVYVYLIEVGWLLQGLEKTKILYGDVTVLR